MRNYTLLLAETALEPMPESLWSQKSVSALAASMRRRPRELLLDSAKHRPLMQGLADWRKRGRPDIAHFCSLLALDSRLNKAGKLEVIVHCRGDNAVYFDRELRLPRIYDRFCGAAMDLLRDGKLEHEGKVLAHVKRKTPGQIIDELAETHEFIAFDADGEKTNIRELARKIGTCKKGVCIVIGGFAHGSFQDHALANLPRASIAGDVLSAWTVVATAIAACEEAEGI